MDDDILFLIVLLGGGFFMMKAFGGTHTVSGGTGVLGLPLSAMSAYDQQVQMERLLGTYSPLGVPLTADQIRTLALQRYNLCVSSGRPWISNGGNGGC